MLGISLWKTVYKALTTLFRESPNALIFSPVDLMRCGEDPMEV